MKIVVVASLAYSLVNFRGRLLAAMIDMGHSVLACAPDEDAETERQLRMMGVSYHRLPMIRTGTNPLDDLRTLTWLVGFLRREKPDVVLAYTQKPILYAGVASRLARQGRFYAMVSGLGHVFSDGGGGLLRSAVSVLYRYALGRARAVFVFNRDDEGEMLRHHILRRDAVVVQVPGSGVDLSRYGQHPPPAGPPTFLLVARLLCNKGHFEFAEAARIVRARHPEVRFGLLGPPDPGEMGVDMATIAAWQAEGVVEYLGETRDVRPYLAAATVVVLPSWYREGLPRTLLEAMATGRAVITTDMPGCREPVIPGETGYLVPARDAEALAAAMIRFVDHPALAVTMGAAGRKLAEQRFAVERVNDILLRTMDLRPDPPSSTFSAPIPRMIAGGAV